ncbi:anaerobic sulfatase maturase [Moraxella oculi]|uniref:Anaerobic sulfatase maturase n=1 Tax=Moraxella oculi TaxID=2940516 RepID=A0ABW8U656_9GAMM
MKHRDQSVSKDKFAFAYHAMLKPSGSKCNIDCDYCFYLHKQELLAQPEHPRMDMTTLEKHIKQYIQAQTTDEVVFTWQGGEPTIMGLDFFRQAVTLQKYHAKPNQRIVNDLQTNGLLLDDAWCQFLKQENFLVGISIDGPAELHDKMRKTKNKKPTHALVMRAIDKLHAHQIPFHALCVVNAYNSQEPMKVYHFLRDDVRPRMIQFLSAVEPIYFNQRPTKYIFRQTGLHNSSTHSTTTDWSVNPKAWGDFLCVIWQEWFRRDIGKVFIDQFENTISQALGLGAQKCITAPICGKAVAIEHDGSVYSCDHFVYPSYRLGNIHHTHQGSLVFSEQQASFGYAKHLKLPNDCRQCDYLNLCWGECPKNHFTADSTGEFGLNYLCQGLKIFYRQVTQDLPKICEKIGM